VASFVKTTLDWLDDHQILHVTWGISTTADNQALSSRGLIGRLGPLAPVLSADLAGGPGRGRYRDGADKKVTSTESGTPSRATSPSPHVSISPSPCRDDDVHGSLLAARASCGQLL